MASYQRLAMPLFVLLLGLIWALSALFYLALPPSPDQSVFDYVGFIAARGGHYYRDAFDISWPGPFLYHEAGVRIFGAREWTARAVDLCLLPIGLLGLWLFARNAGFPRAGIALLLLYPPCYVTSGGWLGGHRDIVAMHFLVLAASLMLGRQRALWRYVLVGALIGYTTMLRPTYLFAALPFWIVEMRQREGLVPRAIVTGATAAGLATIPSAFLAAGLIEGTLNDWYEQAVLFPTTAYQVPLSRWRLLAMIPRILGENFLWPCVAALVGYLLWSRAPSDRESASPAKAFWWSLVATVLVSFFVQNKGFGYHLGGLLPLMLLAAAIGLEVGWLKMRGPDRRSSMLDWAMLVMLCAVVGLGTLVRVRHFLPAAGAVLHNDLARYVNDRQGASATRVAAAKVVRDNSSPQDRVLQWGWNYEIPFLAERLPTTHLINTNLLAEIRPQDTRLRRWLEELASELTPRRAKLIIVDQTVMPTAALYAPPPQAALANRLLSELVNNGYRPIFDRGGILILEAPNNGPPH